MPTERSLQGELHGLLGQDQRGAVVHGTGGPALHGRTTTTSWSLAHWHTYTHTCTHTSTATVPLVRTVCAYTRAHTPVQLQYHWYVQCVPTHRTFMYKHISTPSHPHHHTHTITPTPSAHSSMFSVARVLSWNDSITLSQIPPSPPFPYPPSPFLHFSLLPSPPLSSPLLLSAAIPSPLPPALEAGPGEPRVFPGW